MQLHEELALKRLMLSLTAKQVADMAGVPTSTVTRIERGDVSPSIATLGRIFDVLGLSITAQRSDPTPAIAAFRSVMSGAAIPEKYRTRAAQWIGRWTAAGVLDADGRPRDILALLAFAAEVTRFVDRPSVIEFEDADWRGVADAWGGTGIEWCVTGSVAGNRLVPLTGDSFPAFYVSDIGAASRAAGLTPKMPGSLGRRLRLLAFDGTSEIGSWSDREGIPMADRWQIVLDCAGGTGRMLEQAEAIIDSMMGVPA